MTVAMKDIRESFEDSTFFSHIGFDIVRFEEGNVLLELEVTETLLNVNKTLHGGVKASMLDLILAMAVRSITKTRCVTVTLNVNYLAPSYFGEVVHAKGKVIQQGYRTVTAEGELFNSEGEMITKGVATFRLIRD